MLSKALSIKTAVLHAGNVDMHMYTKFDQNIPCGSRIMNILLTTNGWN